MNIFTLLQKNINSLKISVENSLLTKTLVFIIAFLFLFSIEQSAQATDSKHHATKYSQPFFSSKVLHTHLQQVHRSAQLHAFLSPQFILPSLANGQSALPSNANNFHNNWNASVDSRTGNAYFTTTLASFLFDQGQGRRDLTLSYTGGPSALKSSPFGLGSHWSFNVGNEHPSSSEIAGHKTTEIITGDGHAFTMISVRNSQGKTIWQPLRHKLNDVKINGTPGNWVITMDTGVREHLLHGYEDWEESRDGRRVWFYYDRNGPQDITRHLIYVCAHSLTTSQIHDKLNACPDNGVWLTYQGPDITIHGQQTLIIHTFVVNGTPIVRSVTMASLSSYGISNSDQPATLSFAYDTQGNRPSLLHCITEPTGEKTTFLYNQESSHISAQFHGLPVGMNHAFLPVVTEQITTPPKFSKQAVSEQHLWYKYSIETDNKHNYTGYQAGVSMIPGRDNLMDRESSYTYQVTVDNGLVSTTTVYNKYHLPLRVKEYSDQTRTLIASSYKEYTPWKNTRFDDLPPDYSQPQKITETLYSSDGQQDFTIKPKHEIQQKRYNSSGQVIWQKDAYGRETFTQYCPPQGDNHCPAIDPDWPANTMPEKIMQIPAKQHIQDDSTAVAEVEYDYIRLPVKTTHRQTKSKSTQASSNSSPSFWQVKTKKVGALPISACLKIKKGDRLPELTTKQVIIQTCYQYELNQNKSDYGQLTQVKIMKFTNSIPNIVNKPLQSSILAMLRHPTTQLIFQIHNHADSIKHTRTITISSSPESIATRGSMDRHNVKFMPYSLGTSIYSLTNGLKLAEDDPLKLIHTTWSYDQWNRPVREVMTPTTGGQPKITTWHYIVTPQEIAVVTTYPHKGQTKTVFADNHVLSTWHRFASEAGDSMEGNTNWIPDSKITYTPTEKPATETVWHAGDSHDSKPGPLIALTTKYGYNMLNREVWEKTPDGMIRITVRDYPDRRKISYNLATGNPFLTPNASDHYPTLGPTLKVIDANVLGKQLAQYIFPLDPTITKKSKPLYSNALQAQLRALRAQLQPPLSLKSLNSKGLLPTEGKNGIFAFVRAAIKAKAWYTRVTTSYDGNGRQVKQTLGNGATTKWRWKAGDLVATETPDGRVIRDAIDLQGFILARCVQPVGQHACHILGSRSYNSQGLMLWEISQTGQKRIYHYDADGRLTSMITPPTKDAPRGHLFTYQYNSLGKTMIAVDGHPYVKYIYNPVTWKLSDKEDQVSHLHYEYDPNTSQISCISRQPPKNFPSAAMLHYPTGSRYFTYDRFGKLATRTDIMGNRYTFTHDVIGHVTSSFVQLASETVPRHLTTTSYDKFGRPKTIHIGSVLTEQLTYNSLGQVDKVTTTNDHFFQRRLYIRDPDTNNITSITRQENQTSATQVYIYDKLNNLTDMHCHTTGQPDTISDLCPRDTDTQGSRLTSPPQIFSQHYTFDSWNNLKTVSELLIAHTGSSARKKITYTYAGTDNPASMYDPHRLVAITTHWQNQRYSAIPKILTYDALGRIISDTDGNLLHYNALGQLDRFTLAKTGAYTRYNYDSNGYQIAEQSFTAQNTPRQKPLYMLYQNKRIVAQIQNDDQHKRHVSVELGDIAHSEDGVINRWYLHNYKGDVLDTFSNTGKWLKDNTYSPYGMLYDRFSRENQSLPARLFLNNQKNWWQKHEPDFDNQMTDPATGYQFLGGGYRAYNPVYRHFMLKDSLSPFVQIDGYGFSANNPVMNTDPSGHMPKWANYIIGGLGIVTNLVFGVVFPGLMVASGIDTSLIAAGIASATMMGVSSTASGSLQIASTAHPENKSLSIASKSFDIISNLGMIGLGGVNTAGGIVSSGALTSSMLITSGITGTLSGVTGGISSGMGLSEKSGIVSDAAVLNNISQLLMTASFITAELGAMSYTAPESGAKNFSKELKELAVDDDSEHCFTQETPITLASNKQKSISTVHLGEQILTAPKNSSFLQKSPPDKTRMLHWYAVDLIYSKTFPYKASLQHDLPINCTAMSVSLLKKSTIASPLVTTPSILFCQEHIHLLRSLKWVIYYQMLQKKQGYISLNFPEMGVNHIKAHMFINSTVQISQTALQEPTSRPVSGLFIRHVQTVKDYTFKNENTGEISHIHATPEHPFYVMEKHQYIPVSQLSSTDLLINSSGEKVAIICPKYKFHNCGKPYHQGQVTTVYNLEVYKKHCYFAGKAGIKVHNNYHKCEICGMMFQDENTLAAHMEMHPPYNGLPFSCKFCRRSMRNNSDTIAHHLHTGEQPSHCTNCDHLHQIWHSTKKVMMRRDFRESRKIASTNSAMTRARSRSPINTQRAPEQPNSGSDTDSDSDLESITVLGRNTDNMNNDSAMVMSMLLWLLHHPDMQPPADAN